MPTKVLLTGFGPFGGIVDNPSSTLVRESGFPHRILEVSYEAVRTALDELATEHWDALLMLGVAAGRQRMTAEMFARNHIGKTPDVRGEAPFGPIALETDLILPTSLWTPQSVAAWTLEFPLKAGYDAGTYLCNFSYFEALRRFPDRRVGFLHVTPFERVSQPVQAAALAEILSTIGG